MTWQSEGLKQPRCVLLNQAALNTIIMASMRCRTSTEIGGIILAVILMAVGVLNLVFPTYQIIFHHDAETGHYSMEWVTPRGMQVYGVLAIIVGLGLLWFATRPGRAKASAIGQYVWTLPQHLSRRFGKKNCYTVQEVSRAALGADLDSKFIAYAHAIFCSRKDFDECYPPRRPRFDYTELRRVVSRRYLGGALDFDALTLIRMAKEPNSEENQFCEGAV
jgi:hypothetical protein